MACLGFSGLLLLAKESMTQHPESVFFLPFRPKDDLNALAKAGILCAYKTGTDEQGDLL